MPCAVLLFFLTGLSFEIKRIIIAFWAFVKREIENFSRKFWGGERRIATGAVRPRNDMVFTRGAVRRRDTWVPPYNHFCRAGPVCPAGSAKKTRSGRCRHRPLRSITSGSIFPCEKLCQGGLDFLFVSELLNIAPFVAGKYMLEYLRQGGVLCFQLCVKRLEAGAVVFFQQVGQSGIESA